MTILTVGQQNPQLPSYNSFLIAGLGNPGREYRDTRHNVGFMLLDQLAEQLNLNFSRIEMKSFVTKTEYKGNRLILAKPQTFMNLSGQAVASLLRFYKIDTENLLVVYDEVDLPLGSLRIRPAGGSAGHRGMESILTSLGTDKYPRMRIGIGRPPGRKAASNYVLENFHKSEQELLLSTLDSGVGAVFRFVEDGLDSAMNQYNSTVET